MVKGPAHTWWFMVEGSQKNKYNIYITRLCLKASIQILHYIHIYKQLDMAKAIHLFALVEYIYMILSKYMDNYAKKNVYKCDFFFFFPPNTCNL